MNNINVFNYNGSKVTFNLGDGSVMANATEMAKPFGKQPIDWLKTNQSKDYIGTFSKLKFISLADLVQVTKGGDNPGTWMHEDIAIEFARWLSPAFAIWCNDKIKELLSKGKVYLTNISKKDIARLLLESEEEKEALLLENKKKSELINYMKPKAEFTDRVKDLGHLVDIGQASKLLKLSFGRNTLYKKLREKGIFFRNRNEPKQEYISRGYFELRISEITRDNHPPIIASKVLVTQKGLYWLSKLFEADTNTSIPKLMIS